VNSGIEGFIEVDSCQRAKSGQLISGNVLLSEKVKQEGRIVTVLSDGLGSGVVYFLSPRQLLVLTGAPFNFAHDHDLAKMAAQTHGRMVICGGTTANIIFRLLDREIKIDMGQPLDPKVLHPPRWKASNW
jgi:hypothetical protein